MKCGCCGRQCDNQKGINERCPDCYYTYTHYGCCGRCVMHCTWQGYGPDRDVDEQIWLTALAEGRVLVAGQLGSRSVRLRR